MLFSKVIIIFQKKLIKLGKAKPGILFRDKKLRKGRKEKNYLIPND